MRCALPMAREQTTQEFEIDAIPLLKYASVLLATLVWIRCFFFLCFIMNRRMHTIWERT